MQLHRIRDPELLRLAWNWDEGRPDWFRQMDAVFSQGSVESLISQLSDPQKAFIGVFNPDLSAVVIIEMKGNVFEGHLMAAPHADAEDIVEAITQLSYQMLDFGMREIVVWVAEKNRPVRRICERANLYPDGVVMFKGAYRRRVIRWLRHSITREQLNAEADTENRVQQPSSVRPNPPRVQQVH